MKLEKVAHVILILVLEVERLEDVEALEDGGEVRLEDSREIGGRVTIEVDGDRLRCDRRVCRRWDCS